MSYAIEKWLKKKKKLGRRIKIEFEDGCAIARRKISDRTFQLLEDFI